MEGLVNKVIPMSLVDGPGNRTAVFLQACNFNCAYCHNPETIRACIHCGDCIEACPVGALAWEGGRVAWDMEACIDCDSCLKACPHSSSPKVRRMTAQDLAQEVAKNIPFITGVTASGGEACLQGAFLEDFFGLIKDLGLSTLADTNGSLDLSSPALEGLLGVTDGFMVDVKAWEEEDHLALTGMTNEGVKKNLTFLAGQGKLAEVRTVCLKGADNEGIIKGLGAHLAPYLAQAPIPYKLISYRPFGVREEKLDKLAPLSDEEMQKLRDLALDLGFGPVILT